MTLHIYANNPNINDMNERRAICRVGHILQNSHCGDSEKDDYLFIGNIDGTKDPQFQKYGYLTQLDGLLLGPNFIAIIEFKNYFDPIIAENLDDPWFAETKNGREHVKGGNRDNPYLQAKNARRLLHNYLRSFDASLFNSIPNQSIKTLFSFVLFHPSLHPNSTLPKLGTNDYWIRLRGVDAVAELALTAGPKEFHLTLTDMERIAKEAFFAQKWKKMEELLKSEWGGLYIKQPDNDQPTRIRLWHHDEFTLGRSSQFGHRFILENDNISRSHAHFTLIDNNYLQVVDLESKNGIFKDDERVDTNEGILFSAGETIILGSNKPEEATAIWFEKKQTTTRTRLTLTSG
ncbi:MAG: NERD domain-containing protein [Chloroflexota bacterium]